MKQKNVAILAEIGVMASLALVFDMIASTWGFVNGGSISIAMLPIVVVAVRRGTKAGLLAGLLLGVLQIVASLRGLYLLNFTQFLLDYVLAFLVLGFAGLFPNAIRKPSRLIAGIALATLLRLIVASAAGVAYWSEYIPDGIANVDGIFHTSFTSWLANPTLMTWIGSIVYNAAYLIPSALLTIFFALILQSRGVLAINLDSGHKL